MSTRAQSTTSSLPSAVSDAITETPAAVVGLEDLTQTEAEETNRWLGITGVALLVGGLGLFITRPGLVALTGVGIYYALYYRYMEAPELDLEIERELSDPTAAPGEEISVTLRITNVGDAIISDLRLVDGVPPALAVSAGEPRHATTLRPGQTATIVYNIEVRRGHHEFEELTLIARDIAGTHEVTYEASVPSVIHCEPEEAPLPTIPLRQLTRQVTGRVETEQGGPGLEFYATREYRRGDALSRIDWNRKARTGEMSTLQYREEQAATVILVLDVRPEAYVAGPQQEIPAGEIGIDAAAAVFFNLLDAGDRVGITTLGARDCWLPPGLGTDHRAAGRILFGGHPALGSSPPEEHVSVDYQRWHLEHRLPIDAQIIYVSPFADQGAERYATMLDARGHLVTALSPDPTGRESPGQLLATVERQQRIARLRDRGVRVIDWNTEESLSVAIEEAASRW